MVNYMIDEIKLNSNKPPLNQVMSAPTYRLAGTGYVLNVRSHQCEGSVFLYLFLGYITWVFFSQFMQPVPKGALSGLFPSTAVCVWPMQDADFSQVGKEGLCRASAQTGSETPFQLTLGYEMFYNTACFLVKQLNQKNQHNRWVAPCSKWCKPNWSLGISLTSFPSTPLICIFPSILYFSSFPGMPQNQSEQLPGLHPVQPWLCLVQEAGRSASLPLTTTCQGLLSSYPLAGAWPHMLVLRRFSTVGWKDWTPARSQERFLDGQQMVRLQQAVLQGITSPCSSSWGGEHLQAQGGKCLQVSPDHALQTFPFAASAIVC